MTFALFQDRLIDAVRARLRNGEITERGFARRIGVSQPHIHNVLKGVRILTPRLADLILAELEITILDLAEIHELRLAAERIWLDNLNLIAVPLADGRLGPGQGWPDLNCAQEWVPLNRHELNGVADPVAIHLIPEAQPEWSISANTLALVDRAEDARCQYSAGSWYVLRVGDDGAVGQARLRGSRWHISGNTVPLGKRQQLGLVKGRVIWVGEDPRFASRLSQRGLFLEATSS